MERVDPSSKPTPDVIEDARLAGATAGTMLAAKLLRRSANDTVMFELACQAAAAKGAEHTVDLLVSTARKQGRSWSEIAEALGVTKQGAHQRYRHLAAVEDEGDR
jgi:hypothetical protein